jgi:capsular polysaccharide biosynthesis protein
MQEQFVEENTIDLQELFSMLWKNIWFIIGVTALITLLTASFTYFIIDKQYSSETTIYVSPNQSENGGINYNDLQINQRMVKTYAEIIKSRTVLEKVRTDLNLTESHTIGQIRDSITVSAVNDTEIILIQTEFNNPELAQIVAKKVAEVFMTEVDAYVDVNNLKILDPASYNENPVSPNLLLNTVIGFVLGGMISVGIVLLKEFLNRTIRTDKDIEKYLNVPILGIVPDYKKLK